MKRSVAIGTLAVGLMAGCAQSQESGSQAAGGEASSAVAEQVGPNSLSAAERTAGWELLFDGRTTTGWRTYNLDSLRGGWSAQDGMLTRTGEGGDIITDRSFRDFELSLEWRLEAGGNSGVFYRAAEGEEWVYHSAPEMQVLDDDGHPDGANPLTSAGSDYGLYPAPRGVVHPVGEWNQARVLVRGSHVEHWLNGTRIVEYELGSPDWEARVAESKFVEWPAYGRAAEGHIGLQDHGDPVWYRNIKVRVIR
jgi:hypothetical protein